MTVEDKQSEKLFPIKGIVGGESEIKWAMAKFCSPDGRVISFVPDESPWISGRTFDYNDFFMGLSRQERFNDLWDALCALHTKWFNNSSISTKREEAE